MAIAIAPDLIEQFVAAVTAATLKGEALPTGYGTLTNAVDTAKKTTTVTLVYHFVSSVDATNPDNITLALTQTA